MIGLCKIKGYFLTAGKAVCTGKETSGQYVLRPHRRAAPVFGARFVRSYVPLRCGPSESVCGSNTYCLRLVCVTSEILFI